MGVPRFIIEWVWFYIWNLAGWIPILLAIGGIYLAKWKSPWPGILTIVLCFLWCSAVMTNSFVFYTTLDPTPMDRFLDALETVLVYLGFNIPTIASLLVFILVRRRRRRGQATH